MQGTEKCHHVINQKLNCSSLIFERCLSARWYVFFVPCMGYFLTTLTYAIYIMPDFDL